MHGGDNKRLPWDCVEMQLRVKALSSMHNGLGSVLRIGSQTEEHVQIKFNEDTALEALSDTTMLSKQLGHKTRWGHVHQTQRAEGIGHEHTQGNYPKNPTVNPSN